ncbi:hypothetical protein NN561_005236 [Cricetulus griseus]
MAFGLPSWRLHASPRHTCGPSPAHLYYSQPGRALSPETPGTEPPPRTPGAAPDAERREGAPAPANFHWPSRLSVAARLDGGRAGTSGLGGAKDQGRGLTEEEAGQAGRRLTRANHGQPGQEGGGVRQRHWGKTRRGGRVYARGARGPSAAGLRYGGAGRRAGRFSGGRRSTGGRAGARIGPELGPGARLPQGTRRRRGGSPHAPEHPPAPRARGTVTLCGSGRWWARFLGAEEVSVSEPRLCPHKTQRRPSSSCVAEDAECEAGNGFRREKGKCCQALGLRL